MTKIKYPGIYFDLPEDDYHAEAALSNSGIKNELVSPLNFWQKSWMNPDYEQKRTPAMDVGKAYHTMILEGDDAFYASYAVAPSEEDHPDALDGTVALKAYSNDLGMGKTGTIAELCAGIREVDKDVELWPEIKANFAAETEGKEIISREIWDAIVRARFLLEKIPSVKSAFTNGYPEVSIFWIDRGVRMKARIDWLKVRSDGSTGNVDLKTFANQMGKEIRESVIWEITNRKYFCQPVTYTTGLRAIKEAHLEGNLHVDGEVDQDWLEKFLASKKESFHFVFIQTGDITNLIAREFSEFENYGGNGMTRNAYWYRGIAEYTRGIDLFIECMKTYGAETPWITDYGNGKLKDDDFPPYALETRHVG